MQGKVIIVGLGPGGAGQLSLDTIAAMRQADEVILRTSVHPSVEGLAGHGISYCSLDDCYAQESFAQAYGRMADICIERARGRTIVYAVPGSPLVAETTVALIRERAAAAGLLLEILPALSFLDVVFSQLRLDPVDGLSIVDALTPGSLRRAGRLPLLVTQMHDRRVASEVKLALMERYPDEFPVVFLRKLGLPEQEILQIPLFELDRQKEIDHLTSLYVPSLPEEAPDVAPLVDTMARLRAPDGCPWDREQDHRSLRQYLIEETYEALDALDRGDDQDFCGELGDLLLQIVFHARLAEERGCFDMQDIVNTVVTKMYRRHPHVFGTMKVNGAQEVIANWEAIKKAEYQERKTVLDGVPDILPALMAAAKLQGKASRVGFDWPEVSGIWDKLAEELGELREACSLGGAAVEHELGDVLFVLANLARRLECNPEVALYAANQRFKRRFSHVEECVRQSGRDWREFTLEELDIFWQQAKSKA